MVMHASPENEVITWEQIPHRAIFQHKGDLWVKLSERYISRVIQTDDAWLIASKTAIEYEPSWIFKATADTPYRIKPNCNATLLRSRASPFLFWLIVGSLSSILSLLLLLRSLR
ncbi:MAG: hypothetical protein A3E37_04420 [Candidatus Andersenbacteria bacterium RIFCSPHIGHO2_12_FULL_46_9]|nr:MAG: hypothetical protein UW94_C0009G0059 [Parcubacteria group bacterium GW2011_GWA2_45_14]OGY34269.1 MAG: hypothetical protein A3B76_00500 [Candidatus Andersenbacteria bacterium RIFCSPHIGHO2_02_FULL_46_16]OGY36100.1 MAG: hypothetical protein A3E37_04420 [Candidatus Andersenbacteria bacterium RIFCSPHIGHO2_12_FULL_46_9]OGY36620.1 MAG: hypothetical protein A3I08_01170 [Candidatus Andersenbacteria bacterium RIFCSPLOWO2_02_FULL_46_11]OGY41427.1 MAG: hypothetical protein A3G57_00150 [Candidatus A